MKSYFFNAEPTADLEAHPSGYDREYDADDYNEVMRTFFRNGVFANRDPEACKVSVEGNLVSITPGACLINGGQGHIEEGEGVTLSGGDGQYSIMCRKNISAAVRAFELVALKGATYPEPVRIGDIYDICLARVLVAGTSITVTDTRADDHLCGFAAAIGQPPYQPATGVPAIVWDYTLFPEQMTEEQRVIVENTPSLKQIYEESAVARLDEVLAAIKLLIDSSLKKAEHSTLTSVLAQKATATVTSGLCGLSPKEKVVYYNGSSLILVNPNAKNLNTIASVAVSTISALHVFNDLVIALDGAGTSLCIQSLLWNE